MERLKASDKHYEETNRLQTMYQLALGIRMAFKSGERGKVFIAGQLVDMQSIDLPEIEANIVILYKALEGQLDKVQIASLESVYGEFMGKLKL